MQRRHPTGSQECVSRSCKRREWIKHHPRPPYPSGEDEASWYAPGGTMACGGEYAASDMGVANKTLPCGTQLNVCYKSAASSPRHCVRVEVMDRGPYVAGRVFDLQQAPKERLGFPGLGKIHWAVTSWPSDHSKQ
ncbi:MAG TPA: septal ring lytic transglycosylase RlpA family protein [Candidatus Saccharimonadales bacterium]|nr:septal ring lytic transglycosylase RlpA family protein [Candidatus Saccharimonadales bacterium]